MADVVTTPTTLSRDTPPPPHSPKSVFAEKCVRRKKHSPHVFRRVMFRQCSVYRLFVHSDFVFSTRENVVVLDWVSELPVHKKSLKSNNWRNGAKSRNSLCKRAIPKICFHYEKIGMWQTVMAALRDPIGRGMQHVVQQVA